MPSIRDRIDTVVYVMMENRSFDHMLGHLSYDRILPEADGLVPPVRQEAYENLMGGDTYYPFKHRVDNRLGFDLPHEWQEVAAQLAYSKVTKRHTMSGFVESFVKHARLTDPGYDPGARPDPLGFFPERLVPIHSFLAQNFTVCDRWFCPLPAATQPNKTFALCGFTPYHENQTLISVDTILLDWLERRQVRWRVYHDGLSFFALYPRAWRHVLSSRFRDIEFLLHDCLDEADATFPQVIIVEPSYESAPHIGPDQPNDNHAPLPVGFGEEFLRRVYEAVSANADRWRRTVLIVSYDEHGGFWDHVPPLRIPYTTTGTPPHTFETTGVRVPALIVSPLVEPGSVCHKPMDHSAPLQLLGELFGHQGKYSRPVTERAAQGLASVADALTRQVPRDDRPAAPSVAIQAGATLETRLAPQDPMQTAFETAALQLLEKEPAGTAAKYPEVVHWKHAKDRAEG
ncbi:MAG: alkaline phosphatase family protein [Candidatus Krumholzibacteriia bacterium]